MEAHSPSCHCHLCRTNPGGSATWLGPVPSWQDRCPRAEVRQESAELAHHVLSRLPAAPAVSVAPSCFNEACAWGAEERRRLLVSWVLLLLEGRKGWRHPPPHTPDVFARRVRALADGSATRCPEEVPGRSFACGTTGWASLPCAQIELTGQRHVVRRCRDSDRRHSVRGDPAGHRSRGAAALTRLHLRWHFDGVLINDATPENPRRLSAYANEPPSTASSSTLVQFSTSVAFPSSS